MPNPEYFATAPRERTAIDNIAFAGLDMVWEAHREFRAAGTSDRFYLNVECAARILGIGSRGEKSPYITDPKLANLTESSYYD